MCIASLSFHCRSPKKHSIAMAVQILHFIQVFFGDSRLCQSHDLLTFGEGPTAESYIHFRRVRKQNLEYVRRAHGRLQSWSRRLACAELRTEQRPYYCQALNTTRSPIARRTGHQSFRDPIVVVLQFPEASTCCCPLQITALV